jgi:hypothetical protein
MITEPYLKMINIINKHTVEITFSEPMNAEDLLRSENYQFYPIGSIENIVILDEMNTSIRISISKNTQIGALGRQNYLQLDNIHSQSGVLLEETNKIYLNEEISDLDKVFIYPQPVKPNHSLLTFAKLPEKVTIHIFNMNGKLIRTLDEESYFGGIQWDLKDKNNHAVKSGIYIYRIDYEKDEKIGKLVIVR